MPEMVCGCESEDFKSDKSAVDKVWSSEGEGETRKGRGVCSLISSLDPMPWHRRIVS